MSRTPSTVTIRSASLADASAVAPLLGQLGYPADPERVRVRLERLVGKPGTPSDEVFVAAGPEETDVMGMLSVHRFDALHDDAPVALITALVVAESARGLGVGRRLVDQAVETARGWGCTRLLVTTHVRRADAHAFYERIGFEFTGRRYARAV